MKAIRNIPVIRFTREGYEGVKAKYAALLDERKLAVVDLSKARDMGDLSENGWYKAERFKLSFIDRQIRELKYQIRYGRVSEVKHAGIVGVGSTVKLASNGNEVTYSIVGELEGNPGEKKLSSLSPLGKALLEKKVGDTIHISVPAGTTTYTILQISWFRGELLQLDPARSLELVVFATCLRPGRLNSLATFNLREKLSKVVVEPVHLNMNEFKKSGGGIKCLTLYLEQ